MELDNGMNLDVHYSGVVKSTDLGLSSLRVAKGKIKGTSLTVGTR